MYKAPTENTTRSEQPETNVRIYLFLISNLFHIRHTYPFKNKSGAFDVKNVL